MIFLEHDPVSFTIEYKLKSPAVYIIKSRSYKEV